MPPALASGPKNNRSTDEYTLYLYNVHGRYAAVHNTLCHAKIGRSIRSTKFDQQTLPGILLGFPPLPMGSRNSTAIRPYSRMDCFIEISPILRAPRIYPPLPRESRIATAKWPKVFTDGPSAKRKGLLARPLGCSPANCRKSSFVFADL